MRGKLMIGLFLFWSGTSLEDPGPKPASTYQFSEGNASQSKSRGPRDTGDKRLTD